MLKIGIYLLLRNTQGGIRMSRKVEILKSLKELRGQTIRRGQVYMCDFGEKFENEQCGNRYAIIIQNDQGNDASPNVIVIPCTTQDKKPLPVHLEFNFSKENMLYYDESYIGTKKNTALAECITTISKSKLGQYLGTMTEKFMDEKIQPIIECSLGLKRNS